MLVVDGKQNVYTVLPEFTGTLPDSSTIGYTDIHNAAGIKNCTELHLDAPEHSGNARSGTVWTASELGWSERAESISVNGKSDSALISPEFTGTLPRPVAVCGAIRAGSVKKEVQHGE